MKKFNEFPVWSISKWRDFETCPRMYHAKNVTKRWHDSPSDAMDRGKRIHKHMEDAIKYDIELPQEIRHMTPLVEAFVALRSDGGAVYPEMKFGASIQYQKVEFFDGERLRVRFVLDLYVNHNNRTLVVDWKTGKRKPEHEEDAKFYAAFTHTCFGATDTSVQYHYVDNPVDSFNVGLEPGEAADLAAAWYKKFDYADKIIAAENIPAIPCNAYKWCGAWECPHNKNRKIQEAMGVE